MESVVKDDDVVQIFVSAVLAPTLRADVVLSSTAFRQLSLLSSLNIHLYWQGFEPCSRTTRPAVAAGGSRTRHSHLRTKRLLLSATIQMKIE